MSISGLTVVGANVYWIGGQGKSTAAIKSAPTDGSGTVTTVLAEPLLDQDLATDGTHLFFSWTAADDGGVLFPPSEVDSIELDGSGRTSLVTGFSATTATHPADATELFVAGSTFYFRGASSLGNPQLMSAPVAGGTATAVVPYPAVGQTLDLAWADSTGVYFTEQTTSNELALDYVPVGSTTLTTLDSLGGIGSRVTPRGSSAAPRRGSSSSDRRRLRLDLSVERGDRRLVGQRVRHSSRREAARQVGPARITGPKETLHRGSPIEDHGRVVVVRRPRPLDESCLRRHPQRGHVVRVNRTAHDLAREVSVVQRERREHGFGCVATALDERRHDPAHLELADRRDDVSLEVRDADLPDVPPRRALGHAKHAVARERPVTHDALQTLPCLLARQGTPADEFDELGVPPQRRDRSQVGGDGHSQREPLRFYRPIHAALTASRFEGSGFRYGGAEPMMRA